MGNVCSESCCCLSATPSTLLDNGHYKSCSSNASCGSSLERGGGGSEEENRGERGDQMLDKLEYLLSEHCKHYQARNNNHHQVEAADSVTYQLELQLKLLQEYLNRSTALLRQHRECLSSLPAKPLLHSIQTPACKHQSVENGELQSRVLLESDIDEATISERNEDGERGSLENSAMISVKAKSSSCFLSPGTKVTLHRQSKLPSSAVMLVSQEVNEDEDSSSDGEDSSQLPMLSTSLYAPKPAYDQLEVYRLSVLPEESEDNATPSPTPRKGYRTTAPPTHLDHITGSLKSPSPPPLKTLNESASTSISSDEKTELDSIQWSNSNHISKPPFSRSDDMTINSTTLSVRSSTESSADYSDASEVIGTSSRRKLTRPRNLQFSSTESKDSDCSDTNLQVIDNNNKRPSPFELARDFFGPVTSGLFGLAFSRDRKSDGDNENNSPDGSCSPLLSPSSITSQVLALKSPVSTYNTSPSPKIVLNSKMEERRSSLDSKKFSRQGSSSDTFDWDEGHKIQISKSCTNSPLFPLPELTLPKSKDESSLNTNSVITQPIDSGYSDDMSFIGKEEQEDVDKSTLMNMLLESERKHGDYNRSYRNISCLSANKSTSTESESTVESMECQPLLFKRQTINQAKSFSNNMPLSQCRPLKFSKPYSKLVNQVSDEEKSSPTIEISEAEKKPQVTNVIQEEIEECSKSDDEIRRDSLTLPTTAWVLLKRRRRSSGATGSSPANSPVYCTPPDTSPKVSPSTSLNIEDTYNQIDNLTPFHTPRPSFSSSPCSTSRSVVFPTIPPPPLTSRGCSSGFITPKSRRSSSNSDDQLQLIVTHDGNTYLQHGAIADSTHIKTRKLGGGIAASAPVSPFGTPQPSPTTEEASQEVGGLKRRMDGSVNKYQYHRQSC